MTRDTARVITSSVMTVVRRLRNRRNKVVAMTHAPASFWGMIVAHIGIAVFTVGVAMTSAYGVQRDVRMSAGSTEEIGPYRFEFNKIDELRRENYQATRAEISVFYKDEPEITLFPEKRLYDRRNNIMTEAGIDGDLTRDLFVALGEPLEGDAWAVRLYVKPFIRLIWIGTLIMALGGLMAVTDRRYRLKKTVNAEAVARSSAGQAA